MYKERFFVFHIFLVHLLSVRVENLGSARTKHVGGVVKASLKLRQRMEGRSGEVIRASMAQDDERSGRRNPCKARTEDVGKRRARLGFELTMLAFEF